MDIVATAQKWALGYRKASAAAQPHAGMQGHFRIRAAVSKLNGGCNNKGKKAKLNKMLASE
jgi:hypothetical protein